MTATGVMLMVGFACASPPQVHEGKTRQEWVALLKSADHKTRIDAASALGWYLCPAAAPEILPLLSHQQPGTRSASAFALGMCHDGSAEVVHALEGLLADKDEIVRIDAALAVSRLECPKGKAARVLPYLIPGLKNPQRTVIVASWLGRLGPAAEPAVPALIEALSSADVDTRLNVPLALGAIGRGASPALPLLRELQANDPEPAVRQNIEQAIPKITAPADGRPFAAFASRGCG